MGLPEAEAGLAWELAPVQTEQREGPKWRERSRLAEGHMSGHPLGSRYVGTIHVSEFGLTSSSWLYTLESLTPREA